ncbi:MAG: helix-turn-helix domain-containing protein [Burkholderiaceae bacterium]|nr:helix-turn-helix domain-containing protein [Burkholderiaceae bacterium]
MALGNPGTTATEHAAASVLESVCLLRRQPPLFPKQRTDTLHHLTSAAHALCLHTGKTISWLAEEAQPEPEQQEPPPPAPARPLPSIAGRWLSTKEAAKALGFAEQTLRQWSSTESGPIRPTRAGRALRWSGDSILALLRGPVCVRNCQ